MNLTQKQIAIVALSLVLGLTSAGLLFAKSPAVRVTITGSDLSLPIDITDASVLTTVNALTWIGPGFSTNGIPDTRNGFAMWSEGSVPEPPKGLPRYEVSLYGKFPEERIMYVFVYECDPASKKGYVYLPGKGDKWYESNVRLLYRGVEGHWFNASQEFDKLLQPIIRKATVVPEK